MADIQDPIGFELFKNSLFSIADEMALTICRTTYSGVLRDNMDFSTAFADANGKLVAQGLTLPGHLGSIPTALDVVVERFGDDTHPGDVFILNDPFDGACTSRTSSSSADLRRRGTDRLRGDHLPPRRRGGPGPGVERVGLHRDLPGGAADPAPQVLRPGPGERSDLGLRRAQRADPDPGLRRHPGPSSRPARSPSASSSSWSMPTGSRRPGPTCRRSSTTPSG